tara:strand:- start:1193 stop:1492 length:300 start_codon:yes stop_codon:yes gene_type:complete
MNKILLALGLTLAVSTGAFAASSALDAYVPQVSSASIAAPATGASNDLVSYDRAGKDGSPSFAAPQGGIDYTATASVGGVSNEQVNYHRAGNDGSPSYN